MGRRSMNTTKSGRYINPTDQARKVARKKALQKIKKQRQMVRAAVLKGKDPLQILNEMSTIDEVQYDVTQTSTPNEKTLKEKRKKLRRTFDKILKMYIKDHPEKWKELKRAEDNYERRRHSLITHFEAVKHAQHVQVDEIPLPESFSMCSSYTPKTPLSADLPLPEPPLIFANPPPSETPKPGASPLSTLRKHSAYSPPPNEKSPPGIPPGIPPELSSDEEAIDVLYFLESPEITEPKHKTIRIAENDSYIDDEIKLKEFDFDTYLKELETAHRKRERDLRSCDGGTTEHKSRNSFHQPKNIQIPECSGPLPVPPPLGQLLQSVPLGVPPPLVFRQPLVKHSAGIRLPPGPLGVPPMLSIRLPPGPPPGLPPSIPLISMPVNPPPVLMASTPNILSAGPQLINRSKGISKEEIIRQEATIEAKAQIRNISADITKFIPTALQAKRNNKNVTTKVADVDRNLKSSTTINAMPHTQVSKDAAYEQFMKEMEQLL